jgi:transcription initiation factor TFIIB
LSCSECGGVNLVRDDENGELVCQTCGMVVSSAQLSTDPEWRAFDSTERENLPRVGAPLTWTMHDRGLSTNIGWQGIDAMGRRLSLEERARVYRLRKWHQRSKISDSVNRNLSTALTEISKISYQLNLPRNVVETSSVIYRRALVENLIRGRTIRNMAVACIYMACRQCGVVRSLEEVASAADLTKKDAARNYRILINKLGTNVPQMSPRMYIGKLVNVLGLNGDVEKLASMILDQASEMKLTGGRGPSGMAAACIYISTQITDDTRTQGEISVAAQVTEVTIRNRYKELVQQIEINVEL